jgi:hypothetical protein
MSSQVFEFKKLTKKLNKTIDLDAFMQYWFLVWQFHPSESKPKNIGIVNVIHLVHTIFECGFAWIGDIDFDYASHAHAQVLVHKTSYICKKVAHATDVERKPA